MNATVRRTTVGLLLFAACAPAAARAQMSPLEDPTDIAMSGSTPESLILAWPTFSYRLARLMISKYGQPAEARDYRLVWRGGGPWKRTVVYRTPPAGRTFRRNKGRLEQSVAYKVPADKVAALARFDKDIEAGEDGLVVRSDSESENFLAMNLADEVIKGTRTPEDAASFRSNLSRLRASGKSSAYLDGLMFVPGQ
jgi:hypothetical protein